MQALADIKARRNQSKQVLFQRVAAAPVNIAPEPAGGYRLRQEDAPVYRTANSRIGDKTQPIHQRDPRFITFSVLLMCFFAACFATFNTVFADVQDTPNTSTKGVFGPAISDLLNGPVAPIGKVIDTRFNGPTNTLPHTPILSARSYFVVDLDSNTVLAELDSHVRLPVASLVKIATAMTALHLADSQRPIPISVDAARTIPNRMGILPGDILTVEELLYGLLLDSGNDAAAALAEALGGTNEFVATMNMLALDLQMENTNFTNPAGFDEPENYSSAFDMALLTRHILNEEPLLRLIVGTKRHIIESTPDHGWFGPTNLNRLLSQYPGAFGVKTGKTGRAGYTLVATAERNGRTLLVVVLGSKTHFDDAVRLLDFGFSTPIQP